MENLINIGTFDFSENSSEKDVDTEELTENLFQNDKYFISSLPLVKTQKMNLIDAQYAIFEIAKINHAKVNINLDRRNLMYYVSIQSNCIDLIGSELCYGFSQVFNTASNVSIKAINGNSVCFDISISLAIKNFQKRYDVSYYSIVSLKPINLSKFKVTELKLKNATYGEYPVYIDVGFRVEQESKLRNATLFIDLSPKNIRLMIPQENNLEIYCEDYETIERELWYMYFNKALSIFYKKPSTLSLLKTVSTNLTYLRWTKGLSIFKGAKAIGVNPLTLYKLEKGKFKPKELDKINFELLKSSYSIERSDLCVARNFIETVNFKFMKDGYLEEQPQN